MATISQQSSWYLRLLGSKTYYGSPFHPLTRGTIERCHRAVKVEINQKRKEVKGRTLAARRDYNKTVRKWGVALKVSANFETPIVPLVPITYKGKMVCSLWPGPFSYLRHLSCTCKSIESQSYCARLLCNIFLKSFSISTMPKPGTMQKAISGHHSVGKAAVLNKV